MKRRDFLSGVLGGISVGLSGCIDLNQSSYDNSTNNSTNNSQVKQPETPVFEQRLSEPDYEIDRPRFSESAWNSDYLGENMSETPSISFDTLENAFVTEPKLRFKDRNSTNEFVVDLFGSRTDLDGRANISSVDEFVSFGNNLVAVIESGYVSSEMSHDWVRMEKIDDGRYWLHGYYDEPFRSNPDLSSIQSLVTVPKTESGELPKLYVSLTVSTQTVVNFSSEEGIVGVEQY